jgi:hypothetical protein
VIAVVQSASPAFAPYCEKRHQRRRDGWSPAGAGARHHGDRARRWHDPRAGGTDGAENAGAVTPCNRPLGITETIDYQRMGRTATRLLDGTRPCSLGLGPIRWSTAKRWSIICALHSEMSMVKSGSESAAPMILFRRDGPVRGHFATDIP